MEEFPEHGLGIALTDDDLKALGAIVACWAHSESLMRGVLGLFHVHPAVTATDIPAQGIYRFADKRKNWNKSVQIICAQNPEYLDIGVFLSTRGKELQDVRDQACHWAGSRAVREPDGKAHFTNLATNETVAFTTETLQIAAKDIHEWGARLGMYAVLIGFDLMPPSSGTIFGEKPVWMLEILREYRTQSHGPDRPNR